MANAKYKVFDGTQWVQYYLETTAAQVLTNGNKQFVSANTKVNGQSFTLNSDGANASVTITGAHIAPAVAAPSGYTLHYLSDVSNIGQALGKLDQAAYNAAQATPSAYLKSAALSNSDKTLTITKQDNTTVVFNDTNTTYTFAEGSTNGAFSVTPSGGTTQSVPIHGLGAAAYRGVATAPTTGSTSLITAGAVKDALDALPAPMSFKGTVGDSGSGATILWTVLLATTPKEGDTYKVISAHSSAPVCKVGDTIIYNGSAWVIIPSGDEPSGTVTSVGLTTTSSGGLVVSNSPITSSGNMTVNLDTAYGDKKNPYGSKTAHYVLAAPTADNGTPYFRALDASDIPSLSYLPLSAGQSKPLTGDLYWNANNIYQNIDASIKVFPDFAPVGQTPKCGFEFHSTLGEYRFFGAEGAQMGFVSLKINFQDEDEHYFQFPDEGNDGTTPTLATQEWASSSFTKCTVGTTAPTGAKTGDIWIDTNN